MKNSLRKISNEEKQRILEMHTNAVEKEMLNERKFIKTGLRKIGQGLQSLGSESDKLSKTFDLTKKIDRYQNLTPALQKLSSDALQTGSKIKVNSNYKSLFRKHDNDFLLNAGMLKTLKDDDVYLKLIDFYNDFIKKSEGDEIKLHDMLDSLESKIGRAHV